ncbi:MAG: hypothetical protein Kow0074_11670 [Candidatus Zixiibacteriota bacterium]
MYHRLTILFLLTLLYACAGTGGYFDDGPLNDRQRDASMKALLGKEKYLEYVLLTDTTEANEWLRKFWVEHDPTPTTEENEFREEHIRRVRHAIHFFGQGSRKGPPWDERGEVYIRYGEPDERRIFNFGMDDNPYDRFERDRQRESVFGRDIADDALSSGQAPTEVWTYYKFGETFQFEDNNQWGFYKLVPLSDPSLPRQDVADFFQSRLSISDLQPAIYYHEYGENLVDYALDVVRFHSGRNVWRVDVNLGYPISELGRGPDSMSVSLRRRIIIRDEDQREVYGEVGVIHRIIDTASAQNRLMVEQQVCDLPSGHYTLAVTIDDLFSGKTGTYTRDIHLPKYVVSEVHEISDIEMASFVWSIYEPGAPFVKADRMVMPLPSRIYLPGQELAFYYEVYNLLTDESGETRYRVNYEIREIDGDRSFTFKEPGHFTGTTRNARRFGTLNIDDVPPGDYLLTVIVHDELGNHEKSTVTRFRKSS